MMPIVRIFGILLVVLAAGCAGVGEAPLGVMGQTRPLAVDPSLVGPRQNQDENRAVAAEPPRSEPRKDAIAALAPPPAGPPEPVMTGMEAIGIEPVGGAPPPAKSQSAKAVPPPAKAVAKVALPPAKTPSKVAPSPPATAVVTEKIEPPLDVAALTARLRDTDAIGVFTKLALKNQMDDLLKLFRAHHQSGQKASVAPLRQPYDTLVLKVVSVVQGSDPSLASTIAGSREAIWHILADPEKFNAAT